MANFETTIKHLTKTIPKQYKILIEIIVPENRLDAEAYNDAMAMLCYHGSTRIIQATELSSTDPKRL